MSKKVTQLFALIVEPLSDRYREEAVLFLNLAAQYNETDQGMRLTLREIFIASKISSLRTYEDSNMSIDRAKRIIDLDSCVSSSIDEMRTRVIFLTGGMLVVYEPEILE